MTTTFFVGRVRSGFRSKLNVIEMSRIGLGFDTGGTYTDAVIMELDEGVILARSKSLTTRYDLAVGIRGAIENFDRDLLHKVDTVSLSSTLATNSIVEGKGCRVGLICMGSQLTITANVDYSISIAGSYSPTGKETEPLDEDAARKFLESLRGKVDSIAVNGFMSVRNPKHEQRIKEMAKEILGVPTVCGYELSSTLGFNERAITCVMNARLIPVIEELLESVNKVLNEFEIDAPLMVVKGDGSVMSQEIARERPIETILSGPASSINGAKKLAGVEDAIVVDIGGTTTDIGVIRDGKPRLDPEGAVIGGYRTRVMAADITTAGLGGDSRIVLNGSNLYMTALRVTPLCVAASQYPSIRERLQRLMDFPMIPIPEAHYEKNLIMDTEFFIKIKDIKGGNTLSDLDVKFLEYISNEPHSLFDAKRELKEPPISFNIAKMEELGLIQRIGLTPTDIMHARGVFDLYDTEASKLGIENLARRLEITPEEFIDKVDTMICRKISREIVNKVIYEDSRETERMGFGVDLVEKAISGGKALDYDIAIKLNKPIIGLGGPAYDMLPKVAECLGTELLTPENYNVGNAVGAIIGEVDESIEMLIQPAAGSRLSDPACTVFSRLGRFYIESYREGLEFAEKSGSDYVREMAERAGAVDIKITVEKKTSAVTVGVDHNRTTISEMTMIIRATGKPKVRH